MDIKDFITSISKKYNINECIVHVYPDTCLIACMITYESPVEQYPLISFSYLKDISDFLGSEDLWIESIMKHDPIPKDDNFIFKLSFCMRCNNPKF